MRTRRMCPKCGDLRKAETDNHKYDFCEYCQTENIQIDIGEEMNEMFSHATQDEADRLREKIWRKFLYSNPQFDEETFEKRTKEIKDFMRGVSERVANLPKCPTCGSTNIRHIGTGERAVSVIGLGLFSGKIGKNHECLNCKARW